MNSMFQLREEDDVSDWEEGEATVSDDALELPRRVPFSEFGRDIIQNRGMTSLRYQLCAMQCKNTSLFSGKAS